MLEFDTGGPNFGPSRVAVANPLPGYAPGGLQTISASFIRPADTTAYTANDLVGNSTTAISVTGLVFAGAVRAAGECVRIEKVRLRKTGTSLTNASFRVYLCRALPTLSVGDNGVFDNSNVLAIDDIQYVAGYFDVTMGKSATIGARGSSATPDTGNSITLSPATGTTLYGLVVATAAYTPANGETFTCTLEGIWS